MKLGSTVLSSATVSRADKCYGKCYGERVESPYTYQRWNTHGKLASYGEKNETRPLSSTIQKDKLKTDERPQWETGTHQNP